MISRLVYYFYKYALVPLSWILLQLARPFLRGKIREMIEDKNAGFYKIDKSLTENALSKKRPLWIHAASGEIEYARPLIREFKEKHPDIPILVTYSSPSAKKILESLHGVDVWAALPWDFEFMIRQFIKKWNPRALLFARTDVWPVTASTAKKQEIPIALFSATFADNSSRLEGVSRYLTSYTLNALAEIHCVSELDTRNLEPLQLKVPCFVTGDTRFDQVFHRLAHPKKLKSELIPSTEDLVFIAGSTWPEDETHITKALKPLQDLGVKVIIAPHETTASHLDVLEKNISSLGLHSVRYSQTSHWHLGEVLIIDQVGLLAELYTWADIAFIGGSFKKQVHSVMEALAAGLPVMVGPFHQNNREALYYQKKNYSSGMIVQVINSSDDFVVLIQRMKKAQSQIVQIKKEIRDEVGKNRQSTQRVLISLEKFLK